MKKIITVLGARPQFIKASPLSKAIRELGGLEEKIVHTGQHFDSNMSQVFFDEMGVPAAAHNLDISGLSHGAMTGRMLEGVEDILLQEKPDVVMVYGDTNSTLAGALAAAKLHIPVAHVEAGLRSFNMHMPEEINRVLTDRISQALFCPTSIAVQHLADEGIYPKDKLVECVGDVMLDAHLLFRDSRRKPESLNVDDGFILATIHRAENTDNPEKLTEIVSALNEIHLTTPVVLPLHPRTKGYINRLGLKLDVQMLEPVGYLEMLWLQKACSLIVTDSGGVQKEAYFSEVPCVTIRDQTEWTELLDMKVNTLVKCDSSEIINAVRRMMSVSVTRDPLLYGGGGAANKMASLLKSL